jgi:hypothetical protein
MAPLDYKVTERTLKKTLSGKSHSNLMYNYCFEGMYSFYVQEQ